MSNKSTYEPKKHNPISTSLKFSFHITYIFLLTTATITFIEALRSPNSTVRHVLNLETAISLIAGYFYSIFLEKIASYEKGNNQINWGEITRLRYTDWSMTTPLMLLALSLTLSNNIGKNVPLSVIIVIFGLNYMMLYIGYLGETHTIEKWKACILGFIPFFAMFGIIFKKFVLPIYKLSNYVLFTIFTLVWSLYGIVYMFNELNKNIITNILDCFAKCWFGLGLWAYFSKIIVLK